jgi:putative CocE/NonD family hydrolase
MTGESYLGIVQLFAAAAVGRNSPLKAIFPIIAAHDPYRDILTSGGILNLESSAPLAAAYGALPIASPVFQTGFDPALIAQYPDLLGPRARDIAEGFSAQTMLNVLAGGDRAYDGSYWGDARRPADVLANIVANGIPAYLVGGLYDVFQRGEPLNYAGLQNAWAGRPVGAPMDSRQKVTGRYQLLMKPQYHTTVDAGPPDLDSLQLQWFDRWLKDQDTGIERTDTPLHVVEPDGTRRDLARFPAPQAQVHTYYLAPDGTLSERRPAREASTDTLAFSGASLPCDRSTEQWSLGTLELALRPFGLGDPCAGQDVVPASAGPGQLVYTSVPLGRDSVLAGPLAATIYASANTSDTEWVAKLSDVAPDGTATDLTQGALLGSHRALDDGRTWRAGDGLPVLPIHPHTKAAKTPVTPGQVTRYDIELRSMFATLRANHRLRLTLLSSQTPHLLPLPEDLANLSGGVYQVHRRATAPSSLQLPLADPAAFTASAACATKVATPHGYIVRRTLRFSRRGVSVRGRAFALCRTDAADGARVVKRVTISIARWSKGRCAFLRANGELTVKRSCRKPVLLKVRGTTAWTFRRKAKLPPGLYRVYVSATDGTNRVEPQPRRQNARFRVH